MTAAHPYVVMLVAAEASGDVLGAGLARALKTRLGGQVRFIGVGGPAMAKEGVESPFDIAELSILGLLEGLLAYPRVLKRANEISALARRDKPDIAILIDSWGFTLRVAHRLRRQDPTLPLIKYVGPQVWASRPGRAKVLAKAVDELLSIHTFEAPYFERAGLPTTFVGNSALYRDLSATDPVRGRIEIGAGPHEEILLLLPGSRPAEIKRLMPIFRDAAERLMVDRPLLRLALPAAETVAELVRCETADWSVPLRLLRGDPAKYDAMRAATVALACSGTVTTELALAQCPIVVAYRVGPITHFILKRLLTTKFATLFNIAAGEAVAPEFLQEDCTSQALVTAVKRLLDDPALRAQQIERQNAALQKMDAGGRDPSTVAAEAVIGRLTHRSPKEAPG